MGIYEKVIAICKENHGRVFSTSEIRDVVHDRFGSKKCSIIPSDYCYNRINEGIDFKKHIFVRVGKGKFKFVDENYLYSGKIYFQPIGQTERVVGEYDKGSFYLWERFPKVSIEHYKPELNPNGMDNTIPDDIQEINDSNIPETEKAALVSARIGQGQFMAKLIEYWGKCPLTGCSVESMLRASHIRPWRDSSNSERLDPFNGILLSPNYDTAFDQGLITFDEDGCMIASRRLDNQNIESLDMKVGKRIVFDKRHHCYLEYHRNNRFQV